MSLGRPNALITIDGRSLTAAEAALVRLRIQMASGVHDAAELTFWPGSKFAGTAPGAEISIALGNTGDEEDVWAGEVAAADASAEAVHLDAIGVTAALSRERKSQTYVSQTVADIVRDLAGSVSVDEAESSLTLAAYSVDTRRTAWAHLRDLAQLVGADLASAPDGGLRFVPVREGPAKVTLRHGAELLAWSLTHARTLEAETVAAYGAGSEEGAARWHWLRNDPAGSGGTGAIVAAFRTKDGADALTEALAARAARAGVRGQLWIVGDPTIRVADLVEVKDAPTGDPGVLRVLSVRHELDSLAGFRTTLAVEGGGGLSGALGL
jgi:hypothetical protein